MSELTTYCHSCGHRVDGAAFCASCGADQRTSASAPAPLAPATPEAGPVDGASARVTCPVCHANDAVRRVSNVLDAATSRTTGESETSTGMLSSVTTTHDLGTMQNLVPRFKVPGEPQPIVAGIGCLTFGVITVLTGIVTASISPGAEGSIGAVVLAFIVATIPTILVVRLAGRKLGTDEAKRVDYQQRVRRLREGYYCARDDVAFVAGGPPLRPEEYAKSFASS